MGRSLRRAVLIVGALVLVAPGTIVWAQDYPPPATLNPECHQLTVIGAPTITENRTGRILVPFQGQIQLEGEPGCVEGPVDVEAQSHVIVLRQNIQPNADGSYRTSPIRLPAHLAPGPHQIMPNLDGRRFFCPILIVDAALPAGGLGDGGGGGGGLINPAARTTSNGGGGGGGGILPKTGIGILLLIIWALVLIGTGKALITAAKRGQLRLSPILAAGGRFRSRGDRMLALPPPDVPYLDTRGFVPVRPQRARSPEAVTEADVFAGGEPDWQS